MLRAPLHSDFRYIHEPLPVGDPAIPVLGHESLVTTLQERLTYSHGGAFLITGFRGVGKSTLVLRALAQTAAAWGRDDRLLLVHLNVARAMTADQLLFAVVRRVFEALDDSTLLNRLPREVLHSLLMAYARTSLSFKQTQADSTEQGGSAGIGPTRGVLGGLAPTVSLTGRRTRSQAMEAAFLAYSETDVEHDLIRIIHLLNGTEGRPQARRRGPRLLRGGRRREARGRLRVHPVVVLDEVDKLTDNQPEAIAQLEELLGRLKNVLTTRGAHFLVIAGPDLHDRALRDGDRGNGVYESVFSWRAYVPCLWQSPRRLVHGLLDGARLEAAGQSPLPAGDPVDDLVRYFRFKARGVPRRLLHEFNALVEWEDRAPFLALGAADWERVRFYGGLEDIVAGVGGAGTPGLAAVAIDEDRRLLGDYHVTDWALRSRGRPFTSADVMSSGTDQRLDPLLRVEAVQVEWLLRHLARSGVLEVERAHTHVTRFGNQHDAALTSYRLSDAYRTALAGFARVSEQERSDQRVSRPDLAVQRAETTYITATPGTGEPRPAPHVHTDTDTDLTGTGIADAGAAGAGRADVDGNGADFGDTGGGDTDTGDTGVGRLGAMDGRGVPRPESAASRVPLVGTVADGRYELLRAIGQGGMGSVYRGRDRLTGEVVAIKLLHDRLRSDEDMRRRLAREAAVGQRLHHPNIARTLALVAADSGEPALITELVEGLTLDGRVNEYGPLSPGATVTVARQLGSALETIELAGVARIDLKPGNVILHPERGAVIIDLGVARGVRDDELSITKTGVTVGTPGYMAPEQVLGEEVSIRTDLYALGLVLIFCLTGASAWDYGPHAGLAAMMYRIAHEDVPVDRLTVSGELKALLRHATARDPAARPSVREFLAALEATPEAAVAPENPLAGPGAA
jgi:hypothetical protein